MLVLTRALKEAWLFGQLNVIGQSGAGVKTDEHARAVAEGLQKLLHKDTAGQRPGDSQDETMT